MLTPTLLGINGAALPIEVEGTTCQRSANYIAPPLTGITVVVQSDASSAKSDRPDGGGGVIDIVRFKP
jgi:hypothetical protein